MAESSTFTARMLKREIIMAIIGGLLAVSAFLLVFISDYVTVSETVFVEKGVIDSNRTLIPSNTSIIVSIHNIYSYRTSLTISGKGIISLRWNDKTEILNLTDPTSQEINLIGANIFNIIYTNSNFTYKYVLTRVDKPLTYLSLPAMVLVLTGNVIVLISIYRILMLRKNL